MSVCSQVNIVCDVCYQESTTYPSIGQARASARYDGWKRRRHKGELFDICVDCLDREIEQGGIDLLTQAVSSQTIVVTL